MVDKSASTRPAVQKKAFTLEWALADEFTLIHGPDPALDDGRLSTLYEKIHALVPTGDGRAALCLSGGGIRSASFGLGVLQALTRRNLLFKFHYLSTVSGGGYIGAWLSAWRKRASDDEVATDLTKNLKDRYNEPPEIAELRANSNYLTPKLGALSADTWTLVALYIRNLLLNWLIFLPAIAGLLLVPILSHDVLRLARDSLVDRPHCVAWAAVILLLFALTVSTSGRFDRGRFRVTQGTFLWFILLPTYLAGMLLPLSALSAYGHDIGPGTGAVAGAGLYGAAWLVAYISRKRRDPDKPADEDPNAFGILFGWMIAGAIAGGLVGIGYTLVQHHAGKDLDLRLVTVCGVGWVALSMFLAESIYLGLSSYSRKSDIEREWLARSSGWFVVLTLAWAALAAVVLYADGIIRLLSNNVWPIAIAGTGAGIAGSWIGTSAKTLAIAAGKRIVSLSMTAILSLATVIFLIAVAIILSHYLQHALVHPDTKTGPVDWWWVTLIWKFVDWARPIPFSLWLSLACVGLAAAASIAINVNRFSSHAIYRNRLIRAFLGAARAETRLIPGTARTQPNGSPTRDPFTGFDGEDNPRMATLVGGDAKGAVQRPGLFHVINMALNVVGGQNLAWQERMAEPFAVTPLASGNDNVGFWRTRHYGTEHGDGLTLGTAMAISGAAASPNQGYHSSPLVGLLMTLFNVRLGWWLGNPSRPSTTRREGPRLGILQVFQELFGLTKDDSKYIYLSDGGHFENLGIYEMVRRRCRLIVASDAGADPDCAFEDLGNAVRKVWIDLGVQIDFEKIDIKKRNADLPGLYCAIGKIRYPELKDPKTGTWKEQDLGYLLYLKPGFRTDGSQPADVTAYGLKHPDFPNESTADQFYSESQMESYRSLGSHIIDVVFGPQELKDSLSPPSVPTTAMGPFWQHIQDYVRPKPEPDRKPGLKSAARVRGPGDQPPRRSRSWP
jgi:hypothetical protein